jgi:glyoxylase-like metal-dependent hydrolase (beta-lactamase superfamily II)
MQRVFTVLVLLLIAPCFAVGTDPPRDFQQPDPKRYPDLFVWRDTCNVYVLRDGDAALLIDLGDGSVLSALSDLGIQRVEWVLFTHHHREQCQGASRLDRSQTKVAVPAAERALFENPSSFRKMKVRLGDAFTVYGSSFVRPSIQPIRADRDFQKTDTFRWRAYEFWCVDTRGNSPGAMSYMLRRGDQWLGFTGDVMLDGARMHTWFDTEWDYGYASGIWALCNSAAQVAGYNPEWLLPSHGTAIHKPASQLAEYQRKLIQLEKLLVRGYPVSTFSGAAQDKTSRPSRVPHFWQVSPHLFKFRGPDFYPNFYLILSDTGHGLLSDCGLLDPKTLDAALEGMQREYGLKQIDAAVISHMHGDHFLQAPHLRERWGAKIWGLDRMAAVCEHPEWFDYAAPIQAYDDGFEGLKFDRLFRSGETFEWEGQTFTIDWMPGQTEFALCLTGMIDGRKVAFTGDNIFGDPDDPTQTGHEAMVAHNSAVLEEGYIYCAEYLKKLQPDILLGGHSHAMDRPAAFIERFRTWAYQMREAFQG